MRVLAAAPTRRDVLCFDLDGTLVDTAPEIAAAVNHALAVHGLEPREPAEVTALIGGGLQALVVRLLARLIFERPALAGRVRVDQLSASADEAYARLIGSAARPYPGVADALRSLARAGVRLGCVSNKEQRHLHRVLEVCGLRSVFELVIGGDSLPYRKPHGSVLRHAVAALGGGSRGAAHVGDSAVDVEAARNAGIAAWAVPYGYNAGLPIAAARPDRVFDSVGEVAAHVLAPAPTAAAGARP